MQVNPVGPLSHSSSTAASTEDKLNVYATKILREVNGGQSLKPNQKLKITVCSEYLPLVYALVETAYKDFNSGLIFVDLQEKELENLKTRYGIKEDFDYKRERDKQLKQQDAAFIDFDENASCYSKAGVTVQEAKNLVGSISEVIPPEVQKILEVNSEEILKGCLDLRSGQPLSIYGSREHLPQILALAEWAYNNGTKLVEVRLGEKRELDLSIPMYQYASDAVLNEVPESVVLRAKEILDKNVARLVLDGEDPNQYEGINTDRIQQRTSLISKAVKPYTDKYIVENPWCVYYLPTTQSAKAAGYSSLKEAAVEARKINRVGKLNEHISNMQKITDKLNHLVKEGYRILHFVSVQPDTEIPDGETDLRVGLTPKSIFVSVGEKTPSGQKYIANVPSEESFTTPDRTKAEGKVKVTRPISIHGSILDGIKFEFKEGKVIKASATKNEDVLLKWLEKNEGVDRLGEISLVAESPIFNLGRIFNSILIDENATCHFALGEAYSTCIEGADEIREQNEKRNYLDELKVNDGTDHVDFMIGSPNVMVFGEKEDGSSRKLLIKNNKFQI